MSTVLVISGSPSAASRTAMVGEYVVARLARQVSSISHLRLRELPAESLLSGDVAHPSIGDAVARVSDAEGLIIATPTFKAAYSGLLKSFLDLLPQRAFARKTILPLATGGTPAHILSLDYGLRPVLQSMGARHVVQSYFLLDKTVTIVNDEFAIHPDSEELLTAAIIDFCDALSFRLH